MNNCFKLTPQAKEAVLRGSMGDITNGIPFDRMTTQVIYDTETDTYRVRWTLHHYDKTLAVFESEPCRKCNVTLDSHASIEGTVTFKLL